MRIKWQRKYSEQTTQNKLSTNISYCDDNFELNLSEISYYRWKTCFLPLCGKTVVRGINRLIIVLATKETDSES
jgi:hypothetical protein